MIQRTNISTIALYITLSLGAACKSNAEESKSDEVHAPKAKVEYSKEELQKRVKEVLGDSFQKLLKEGTYMTWEEAEKRWGRSDFSAEKFRTGKKENRASQAVDLVAKGLYIGKKTEVVERELGRHDGFFWRDRVPAYILENTIDMSSGTRTGELWELVLIPDGEGVIRELRIYRQ